MTYLPFSLVTIFLVIKPLSDDCTELDDLRLYLFMKLEDVTSVAFPSLASANRTSFCVVVTLDKIFVQIVANAIKTRHFKGR